MRREYLVLLLTVIFEVQRVQNTRFGFTLIPQFRHFRNQFTVHLPSHLATATRLRARALHCVLALIASMSEAV